MRHECFFIFLELFCLGFNCLIWCSMQAVIWFLARWSRTYLMPEEFRDSNFNSGHDHEYQFRQLHSRKALLGFFGEHNQGKIVLDIIVRISVTTLLSYPGEKDLQVQVIRPFPCKHASIWYFNLYALCSIFHVLVCNLNMLLPCLAC